MTELELLVKQFDEKIAQLKDAVILGNYEKFEDLGKCIGCASKEELKERKVDLEQ